MYIQEEYQAFLAHWKERMDEPLAIIIKVATSDDSLKNHPSKLVN